MSDAVAGCTNLRGRRVLIVEDEPLIAWDICELLHEAGAVVMEPKESVDAALRALAHEAAPDIALLDVSLANQEPVFAVAAQLQVRHIPFVFYTGYPSSSTFDRFENVAYCEKPMEGALLAAALDDALRAAAQCVSDQDDHFISEGADSNPPSVFSGQACRTSARNSGSAPQIQCGISRAALPP